MPDLISTRGIDWKRGSGLIPPGDYPATIDFSQGGEKKFDNNKNPYRQGIVIVDLGEGRTQRLFQRFSLDGPALYLTIQLWAATIGEPEEEFAFDHNRVHGKRCVVKITHRKSQDGSQTYNNISGFMPEGEAAEVSAN
jgi:hypothetical protein